MDRVYGYASGTARPRPVRGPRSGLDRAERAVAGGVHHQPAPPGTTTPAAAARERESSPTRGPAMCLPGSFPSPRHGPTCSALANQRTGAALSRAGPTRQRAHVRASPSVRPSPPRAPSWIGVEPCASFAGRDKLMARFWPGRACVRAWKQKPVHATRAVAAC